MTSFPYNVLLVTQYVFGLLTLVSLFFISAPYGRFSRGGWGPTVKAKYGWFVMESVAVLTIFILFLLGTKSVTSIIMLIIWQSHYLRRTLFYPFKMKGKDKPFPVVLVILAVLFNSMNGYINGYFVFHLADYQTSWLWSWQFILGLSLFVGGYFINQQSDNILTSLKKNPDDDYVVPQGGLFKYISSPHYFGEIVEWIGWALLTWSWAGLAFAFYTFANLAPRAISHHKWYKEKFNDYPKTRRALIPFLW